MRRAWILLEKPLTAAWKEATPYQPEAGKKILDVVSPALHLYKHPEFQTEREIRLVHHGDGGKARTETIGDILKPVLPTIPFFLKGAHCQIVLGPKTAERAERNRKTAVLKVLLRQVFGHDVPEVEISRVPYQ